MKKNFFSRTLLVCLVFLIFGCSQENITVTNESVAEHLLIDEVPDSQNAISVRERIESIERDPLYRRLYSFIRHDFNYQRILRGAIRVYPEFSVAASNREELEANLESLNDSNVMNAISDYWSQDIFTNTDMLISTFALINATDDIVVSLTQIKDDPCFRDYGDFITSLNILDCDAVAQSLGCCASLYCEVTNCTSSAFLELLDSLGISVDETLKTLAGLLIGYIAKGAAGAQFGLIVAILAKTIVGVLNFGELIIDIAACQWDMVVNYEEWTSACPCACPTKPECDVDGGGRGLGGFDPPC